MSTNTKIVILYILFSLKLGKQTAVGQHNKISVGFFFINFNLLSNICGTLWAILLLLSATPICRAKRYNNPFL